MTGNHFGTRVELPDGVDFKGAGHGPEHLCWFCATRQQREDFFPEMPYGHTLCARCGAFMKTGIDDPSNQQMRVCTECGETLAGDL